MKKILIIALSSLLSVGVLAGCGGSSANSEDSDTITLAVWGSSPAEVTALDDTIASFTEKTGIKVEKEVIQDKYMDVMKARFIANNAPDVFYIDSFELPALVENGVLMDITDSIGDTTDFYKPILDAFKGNDDRLYAVPKDYSTLSLYVNTELLEQAGFKLDEIPIDMSEFFDFLTGLNNKLPKEVAPMLIEKDLARHLNELDAIGANVVTEDGKANFSGNAQVVKFLQQYTDGKKDGSLVFAKDDLGSDSAIAAFGSGKVAMMIDGNWSIGAFNQDFKDLKYATIPIPKINDKNHTMAFTVGYGINNKTDNAEDAKEFVEYMTNEGQQEWCEKSGVLPSRNSVAEKMNVITDVLKKSHVEGAQYATVWSRGATLPVINTSFGNNFSAAMNNQVSLEEALKNIDKEANDEIERQK